MPVAQQLGVTFAQAVALAEAAEAAGLNHFDHGVSVLGLPLALRPAPTLCSGDQHPPAQIELPAI
jgi:hypothetical protein